MHVEMPKAHCHFLVAFSKWSSGNGRSTVESFSTVSDPRQTVYKVDDALASSSPTSSNEQHTHVSSGFVSITAPLVEEAWSFWPAKE